MVETTGLGAAANVARFVVQRPFFCCEIKLKSCACDLAESASCHPRPLAQIFVSGKRLGGAIKMLAPPWLDFRQKGK